MMSRSSMQAAGLLIYRQCNGAVEFLLLQTSYGKHHWSPPKGFAEEGENPKEAAIRETQEEAGLSSKDFEIDERFERTLSYFDPAKKKQKSVHYWLARLINPEQRITLSNEHQDYKWKALDQACLLAEFADMGGLMKDAQRFLSEK